MDILYVVGKPSGHGDQELRWSLRSIAKYGRGVEGVYVASPVWRDWLSDEVEQVVVTDIPNAGYKHHNILNAIRETAGLVGFNGHFLVSSDDHFYLRETDFDHYPFFISAWRINMARNTVNCDLSTAQYRLSCMDGGRFLRDHNLPAIDFQGHMNSHWHGGILRANAALFDEAMKLRYCVEPHVLMANVWLNEDPTLPLEVRSDRKLRALKEGDEERDCISIYDAAFSDPAFMGLMEREFGEKCRYEK